MLAFLLLLILSEVLLPNITCASRVRRQTPKVRISIIGDTVMLRFLQPHTKDTKLEGYILGYGSGLFSKQFIQLPEDGEPFETEIDVEPKYLVAVQPANREAVKKQCTGKEILEKPLHLVIGSVSPTSVMLSWGTLLNTLSTETNLDDCIEDGHYTVRYREKEPKNNWNYQTCPTADTIIDQLKPETPYEFGVRAKSNNINGAWSSPVIHNTAETHKPLNHENFARPKNPGTESPQAFSPSLAVLYNETHSSPASLLRHTAPPPTRRVTQDTHTHKPLKPKNILQPKKPIKVHPPAFSPSVHVQHSVTQSSPASLLRHTTPPAQRVTQDMYKPVTPEIYLKPGKPITEGPQAFSPSVPVLQNGTHGSSPASLLRHTALQHSTPTQSVTQDIPKQTMPEPEKPNTESPQAFTPSLPILHNVTHSRPASLLKHTVPHPTTRVTLGTGSDGIRTSHPSEDSLFLTQTLTSTHKPMNNLKTTNKLQTHHSTTSSVSITTHQPLHTIQPQLATSKTLFNTSETQTNTTKTVSITVKDQPNLTKNDRTQLRTIHPQPKSSTPTFLFSTSTLQPKMNQFQPHTPKYTLKTAQPYSSSSKPFTIHPQDSINQSQHSIDKGKLRKTQKIFTAPEPITTESQTHAFQPQSIQTQSKFRKTQNNFIPLEPITTQSQTHETQPQSIPTQSKLRMTQNNFTTPEPITTQSQTHATQPQSIPPQSKLRMTQNIFTTPEPITTQSQTHAFQPQSIQTQSKFRKTQNNFTPLEPITTQSQTHETQPQSIPPQSKLRTTQNIFTTPEPITTQSQTHATQPQSIPTQSKLRKTQNNFTPLEPITTQSQTHATQPQSIPPQSKLRKTQNNFTPLEPITTQSQTHETQPQSIPPQSKLRTTQNIFTTPEPITTQSQTHATQPQSIPTQSKLRKTQNNFMPLEPVTIQSQTHATKPQTIPTQSQPHITNPKPIATQFHSHTTQPQSNTKHPPHTIHSKPSAAQSPPHTPQNQSSAIQSQSPTTQSQTKTVKKYARTGKPQSTALQSQTHTTQSQNSTVIHHPETIQTHPTTIQSQAHKTQNQPIKNKSNPNKQKTKFPKITIQPKLTTMQSKPRIKQQKNRVSQIPTAHPQPTITQSSTVEYQQPVIKQHNKYIFKPKFTHESNNYYQLSTTLGGLSTTEFPQQPDLHPTSAKIKHSNSDSWQNDKTELPLMYKTKQPIQMPTEKSNTQKLPCGEKKPVNKKLPVSTMGQDILPSSVASTPAPAVTKHDSQTIVPNPITVKSSQGQDILPSSTVASTRAPAVTKHDSQTIVPYPIKLPPTNSSASTVKSSQGQDILPSSSVASTTASTVTKYDSQTIVPNPIKLPPTKTSASTVKSSQESYDEKHKGKLWDKPSKWTEKKPVSNEIKNEPNQVDKGEDKIIDLKRVDPVPVLKSSLAPRTTETYQKPTPADLPYFSFNGSWYNMGSNSSVFSSLPMSEVDSKGNARFVAPHVIYQINKQPRKPCSVTDALSFFPDEETGVTNVTGPPKAPPTNLTVVSVEGCSSFIILDWMKADNETTEYEVTSSVVNPNGHDVSVVKTNQTHTAVENLKPESSYEFTVTPKNDHGSGPPSESVTFSTESADPRVGKVPTGKNAIWSSFPFKADSYSECTGTQYVKRTWYRKFVGIQLCNSLRYKIYLSDSLKGKFYNIGDETGYGEDHCQFVDSYLDGQTGGPLPPHRLPLKQGYFRSMRQEPVKFGKIGGYTQINYVAWYECGVPIPGSW